MPGMRMQAHTPVRPSTLGAPSLQFQTHWSSLHVYLVVAVHHFSTRLPIDPSNVFAVSALDTPSSASVVSSTYRGFPWSTGCSS
ncbi:hypothetical protein DPMN_129159 [Dreissena polymorpha]|uniref:Uncharacterized protein n=1 Tax=Dreissena polymorpha TaxID=45954 RepID=A0A9D4H0Q0_DREPO|nr:hypothetical protein DPMN_129159 [Dreissena polymorpha]